MRSGKVCHTRALEFHVLLTPRPQGLARTQNKMNYMTIAGSDDYMAPEVLLGEKYDEKCDVFGYVQSHTALRSAFR